MSFLAGKMMLKFLYGFHGLIEAGKPTISNDYLEFLCEFKAICERLQSVNQGPRGVY
jgi:hypothetical protein